MTKTEHKELEELGMSPEALAAKQERVRAMLAGDPSIHQELTEIRKQTESLPALDVSGQATRRQRSDAGKPRAKPAPPVQDPPAGLLTSDQVGILLAHFQAVEHTKEVCGRAMAAVEKAEAERDAYIASITAKAVCG